MKLPAAPARYARLQARRLLVRLTAWLDRAIALELSRGVAFLLLPVFLGIGALFYFAADSEPQTIPILSAAAALAAAFLLARRRFWLRAALAVPLIVMLGMLAAKLETWNAGTRMLGSDVTTVITGRIVEVEDRPSGRKRFTIAVEKTERPRLHYGPQVVRATARGNPDDLGAGDRLTGLVHLMAPSGPVRPGGYDFGFSAYFDGIGAVGFFPRDPKRAAPAPDPPPLGTRITAFLEHMREALGAHVASEIGGAEGGIAAALIAGVRGGIPESVQEDLRSAGLSHILSISGLHMVMVAFTVMVAIRTGFALFAGLAARLPVKKYAATVALFVCAFYLFLSGNDVAAQRSFIMLAIMLTALVFDRQALSMRNLAIAALIVLVFSPHEVVGPSFQMSFAATAALVASYRAWSEWRRRKPEGITGVDRGRFGRLATASTYYVAALMFTSLVAGGATGIFAIWHFQRAAPLGLIGNLLAMPVISLSVMPWAVLAVVLLPFGLDWIPLYVMGRGLAVVIAIAHWVSGHSPIDATGLVPVAAVALVAAALVVVTVSTTALRLLALPLAAAGIALAFSRHLPTLLVSEDARLVAIERDDGRLAVNRARPPGFETENWMRALSASGYRKPEQNADIAAARAKLADGAEAFQCAEGVCLASVEGGAVVGYARKGAAAEAVCDFAALVIVADASARDTCRHEGPEVITGWHLARRGSAMVDFVTAGDSKTRPVVTYALDEPWRPWHTQRAWSRAARGLPPYRPPKKEKSDEKTPAKPDASASAEAQ